MQHKSFTLLETKADGDSGEFTALVSTFGNVDRVGDRVLPGAYAKTLARWRASGDPIPIILSHKWDDPMAHIGVADPNEVRETSRGLMVKGRLDVDDNPVARQVHKLMKRRSLKEFSIGYSVPAGGEAIAADGANELSEIDLVEAGPTLKGIDPKTELRGVKAAMGVEDAPASEQDLRRRSEQIERGLADLPLAGDPGPDAKALEAELEALKAELADTQARLESATQTPPAAEGDLRRRSDRIDRAVKARDLPASEPPARDVRDEQLEALKAELAEIRAALAEQRPAASEADLRRESERHVRESVKADLPGTQPLQQLLDETVVREQVLKRQFAVLKSMADIGKRGKRLASDLRERLDAAGTERFGGQDIYVYVDDFDPDEGTVVYYVAGEATPRRFVQVNYTVDASGAVDLATEEIEVVRTTTYRPKKGPTPAKQDEATRPRPADPLRKRSDQAVLEIQSDGASLRKPPPQVTQESADPPPDATDLKRRSREVMLAQLTGDTA